MVALPAETSPGRSRHHQKKAICDATAGASGRLAAGPAIAVLSVTLSESMLSSVLFPFLPWLVRDLGVPADSVALYSGLLSSAFNVSSLAGAVVWGRLSDVHGRLPVLALGLGSNAVSMVLLGLSASFPQAVAARLVAGCLNGNAGIARAAMREMTTEETRAHGFGLMSLAYGVGFFLGTNIGGLLAQPAELVPSLLAGSLLDRFPYLLPCAIATSGGLLSLLLVLRQLRLELRQQRTRERGRGRSGSRAGRTGRDTDPLVEVGGASRGEGGEGGLRRPSPSPGHGAGSGRGSGSSRPSEGFALCVLAQFGLNLVIVGFEEAYSLFCASRPSGLGLGPSDISASLTPLSLSLLLWPLAFPRLERAIGAAACFQQGVSLFLLASLATPLLRTIPAGRSLLGLPSTAWLWLFLSAISLARGVGGVQATTSIALLLNSLLHTDLGLYNGLAVSASALARSIAPALTGWTIGALHGFRVPFYLISCTCVATLVVATRVAALASAQSRPPPLDSAARAPLDSAAPPPARSRTGGGSRRRVDPESASAVARITARTRQRLLELLRRHDGRGRRLVPTAEPAEHRRMSSGVKV